MTDDLHGRVVNVMDFWRPEDDTDDDRRVGVHNILPAMQRIMAQPGPPQRIIDKAPDAVSAAIAADKRSVLGQQD